MKKTLFLSLFLVFVLLLAGCAKQESGNTPESTDGITETEENPSSPVIDETKPGFSASAMAQGGLFCPADGGYYFRSGKSDSLCFANKDGSGFRVLAECEPYAINVIGDTVYFLNAADFNSLSSVPTAGGEITSHRSGCNALLSVGSTLYFSDNAAMYSMKTESMRAKKLLDTVTPVSYYEGKLYCIADGGSLHTYAIEDGSQTEVTDYSVATVTVNEYGIFFENLIDRTFCRIFGGECEELVTVSSLTDYMVDGKTLYCKDGMQYQYLSMDVTVADHVLNPFVAFSGLFFTKTIGPMPVEELLAKYNGEESIASEDGNVLVAMDGDVFIYAMLAEAIQKTDSAACIAKVIDGQLTLWAQN